MVDEKKSDTEEIKNTDANSAPDNNLQLTQEPNTIVTDSKDDKPKGSGAVSYVYEGDSKIEDEQENLQQDEDDEELDDEEYEKIKQDLLNEYMNDENNDKDNSSQADVQSSNTVQIEQKSIANQDSIDSTIDENLQKDSNLKNAGTAENNVNISNSQDSINELMGSNAKNFQTQDDSEIDDVEKKLDGNIIDDDHAKNTNIDSLTPDVDKGISRVAISKGSSVMIMVMLVLLLLYIIYKMLQPDAPVSQSSDAEIDKNMPIVKPVQDVGQTIVVPEIPKFPDAPKQLAAPTPQAMPTPPMPPLLEVTPIAPPPPPPSIATAPAPSGLTPPPIGISNLTGMSGLSPSIVNDIGDLDEEASQRKAQDDARKQSRLKSSIMVSGGGGGGKKSNPNANPQGQDLTKLARNTDQIAATYIGDLHRIIAQGKVIDAVLETAINTDLPGQIRAVVSRDVYSEAGKNILINRGSRLIGSYSANIQYGQARVQIIWDRIIRPDGVDIKIASSGIDDIGRAGMDGEVDNHFMRNLATAIMMSTINVTLANFADKQSGTSGGTTTSTTSTNATTGTTSGSSTSNTLNSEQQAYQNSLNSLNTMTNSILGKEMNMPPTITVDQGSTLKVFVKRDIVFPGPSANLTRMVD